MTLRTGKSWEARWQRDAERMARDNGTKFKRLGSFDGLGKDGQPLPETADERRRRLALTPRKRRVTKADRRAIAERLGRAGE